MAESLEGHRLPLEWRGEQCTKKKKDYFEDYRTCTMTPPSFHFHQFKTLQLGWEREKEVGRGGERPGGGQGKE